MKRIVFGALGATAAAMAVAPAHAQTTDAAPFTGFRVEALAGWDHLRNGSSVDIDGNGSDDIDQSIDGFLYGGGVGYDMDLGGAVVGVEAELTDSTGKEDPGQALNAPFAYRASPGRDIYVGARAGIKATPNMLAYVKGGYVNTKMDAVVTDTNAADGTDYTADAGQTIDGWRAGAGLEYAIPGIGFGSGAYAKLEYRYSHYSKLSLDKGFFASPNAVDIDLDRHQVVAGIGIRF